MKKELIIDVTSSEVLIALLEDQKLVELNKEKTNIQFSVGDIYLGKVRKLMPGLNAAFVDIGSKKDAFLHYLDLGPQFGSFNKLLKLIRAGKLQDMSLQHFTGVDDIDKNGKIIDLLTQGQEVLVQIAKEPISTKGPRLSSEISIAGRNLVLLPFSNKVSVSQKIQSGEEKKRLLSLVQSILTKNYGVIIRTVAEGKKVKELDIELRSLIENWENSLTKLRALKPPKLLIGELNRTSAILRDILNESFNNIFVNDETIYRELKNYIKTIAPEKEKIVKNYDGQSPIFIHHGIDKQIKALFGKTVAMRTGAYLVIEHTEALHVIDVNSGKRSMQDNDQETNALEVNIVAAEEIARQLRLRDMGGIVVIDFIDMLDVEHKKELFIKFLEFMESDRAKHHVLPLSRFGIMQITRQRVRPEMNIGSIEKCPTCRGTGEITPSIIFVDELENNLKYLVTKMQENTIMIRVHPYLSAYLEKGFFSIRKKWKNKYKKKIKIEPMPSFGMLQYQFFDSNNEEIII